MTADSQQPSREVGSGLPPLNSHQEAGRWARARSQERGTGHKPRAAALLKCRQARLSAWGGRPSHPPERGLPKAQPHSPLASPPPRNPTKPSRAAASVAACEPWCSSAGRAQGGVSGRPAVGLILTPLQGLRLPSQLTARKAQCRTPRRCQSTWRGLRPPGYGHARPQRPLSLRSPPQCIRCSVTGAPWEAACPCRPAQRPSEQDPSTAPQPR